MTIEMMTAPLPTEKLLDVMHIHGTCADMLIIDDQHR